VYADRPLQILIKYSSCFGAVEALAEKIAFVFIQMRRSK
jgi:hypothetical protein